MGGSYISAMQLHWVLVDNFDLWRLQRKDGSILRSMISEFVQTRIFNPILNKLDIPMLTYNMTKTLH